MIRKGVVLSEIGGYAKEAIMEFRTANELLAELPDEDYAELQELADDLFELGTAAKAALDNEVEE